MQQTAFNLGFTKFEATPKVLRMADQSRVIPVGKLSKILTLIAGIPFELEYIVISPEVPSTFPILLGRPWLYKAQVQVNWKAQELSFGTPKVVVSWAGEDHKGETVTDHGYTSDFSDSNLILHPMEFELEEVRYMEVFLSDPIEDAGSPQRML